MPNTNWWWSMTTHELSFLYVQGIGKLLQVSRFVLIIMANMVPLRWQKLSHRCAQLWLTFPTKLGRNQNLLDMIFHDFWNVQYTFTSYETHLTANAVPVCWRGLIVLNFQNIYSRPSSHFQLMQVRHTPLLENVGSSWASFFKGLMRKVWKITLE